MKEGVPRSAKLVFFRTNVIASEYAFLFMDFFAISIKVRVADGPASPCRKTRLEQNSVCQFQKCVSDILDFFYCYRLF